MQDPDPKCRHFVISWHFMAFWHVCQKANCITKSAFSAFSRLFPPFRLFHRIRLLDFSALKHAHPDDPNICKNDCLTRPSFLQLAQWNDTDHLKKDTVLKPSPFSKQAHLDDPIHRQNYCLTSSFAIGPLEW